MVCAMAREINNFDTVFHGVSSHMPMIAIQLAKAMHAPKATYLNIPGGVNPDTRHIKQYTSAGGELLEASAAYFPLADVFDLAMRGRLDVAFLSGIQIDYKGHINASVIGDYHKPKVRMPGGAGSAVLIPTAKKSIIWRTKHDRRIFVEQVDFVTTKGNMDKVITPLCIFKMYQGELILESIHPHVELEELARQTGFPIRYVDINYTEIPSKEELNLLKQIDPKGYRYIEFATSS